LCDYFRSKAAAEKLLLASDGAAFTDVQSAASSDDDKDIQNKSNTVRTCSIRPHGIYGPGDTSLFPVLISRAKKGRLRIVGSGDTEVDWTYVDNAVYAHLLAAHALLEDDNGHAKAGGKAYFIADNCPGNPWDFFNNVLRELGIDEVKRKVPLGVAKSAGALMEAVWRTFGMKGEPPGTRAMASVLGNSSWYDLSRARADLNYEPLLTTPEGISLTLPYLKSQLEAGAFD
ncbi:MAG: NAD-dependent epimerase/dehydratase family protein, partial [Deltaproteobacteria bacterium]|nr:NAD-dependent epimerase/dehydratase family protein [Deltaproteobacteria bacterium]